MPTHAVRLRLGRPEDARAISVLVRRVARRWILPDQPHEAGQALLQHQRDVALGCAPVGDVDAVDEDLARCRLLQPGDQPERGGLARADT